MFKTNKQSLWEIEIGYIEDNGNCIDNWSSKTAVASSAEEAISKTKLKKNEYLFGVKWLRDIDVK